MPIIVVTRLRLRDPAFFDEFFASAVAVVEQAQNSEGNLGADVLAEANNTYWTRTVWQERGLMDAFVGSEPHLSTMDRLSDWCDEATFVEWEQAAAGLPDWQDGHRRLVASGQGPSLSQAVARRGDAWDSQASWTISVSSCRVSSPTRLARNSTDGCPSKCDVVKNGDISS